MNPRGPIYWYQGLFLQPQHFQQAGLYIESLLTPLKSYLTPFFWGVCELGINESRLKEFEFELSKGEFLFKDGTWVGIGHNAVIKPRSFKALWERFHEPFTIYVALKRLNLQGEHIDQIGNVNEQATLPKSRYDLNRNQEETSNLYSKDEGTYIASLNYVLSLVWSSEVDLYPEYELLPIARVEYNGQNPVCSQDFVPPVLTLKNSPALFNYLRNTKDALYARSISLNTYKSMRQSAAFDHQATSLPFLFTLKTLTQYVPLLNHFAETQMVSPWEFYGVLRQLLGELSILSEKIDVLGRSSSGEMLVPAYDHTNLGHCFKQICMLIDEILDGLLSSMESVIHLEQESNYFKADIPVELLKDTNNFYLAIKTEMEPEQLLRNIIPTLKVGSQEDISILTKRALSGVPLEYRSEPPLGLSVKRNVNYFRLDHHHISWLSVKEYANFCIFWGSSADNVQIDMYILKGRELLG